MFVTHYQIEISVKRQLGRGGGGLVERKAFVLRDQTSGCRGFRRKSVKACGPIDDFGAGKQDSIHCRQDSVPCRVTMATHPSRCNDERKKTMICLQQQLTATFYFGYHRQRNRGESIPPTSTSQTSPHVMLTLRAKASSAVGSGSITVPVQT